MEEQIQCNFCKEEVDKSEIIDHKEKCRKEFLRKDKPLKNLLKEQDKNKYASFTLNA